MAMRTVFAMYCTSAIMQIAMKKSFVKSRWMLVIDPNFKVKAPAVKKVDVARMAELNRIVRGRLLMMSVAAMPSSAETRIAAEPPYISIVRKTKVSATVIR